MSDNGKPWFRKRTAQQSLLYLLEKPFPTGALASAIFVGLNQRDEGINLKGMTMTSVLPLIEIVKKSCVMEISAQNQAKGYLYFRAGVLIDGRFEKLRGEAAAREIAAWKNIAMKIGELPSDGVRVRIKTGLMEIAGATWKKNGAAVPEKAAMEEQPAGKAETIFLTPESVVAETGETTGPDEKIKTVFDRHLEAFREISGYLMLAVSGSDDEIMALHHASPEFKPEPMVRRVNLFHQTLRKSDIHENSDGKNADRSGKCFIR